MSGGKKKEGLLRNRQSVRSWRWREEEITRTDTAQHVLRL